jgi:hypothetical protein
MKDYTKDKMDYRLYWSYGNMDHVRELTGANFIGYYFLNGSVAGKVGYDFEAGTSVDMPLEMEQIPPVLMKGMNDTANMNIGYWSTSDGTIVLVMVAPIQCGACGFGDITGMMLWAKYVKQGYVKEVASRAQTCVSLYDTDDTTNAATKSILPTIKKLPRGIVPVYNGELEHDQPLSIQTFVPNDLSMLKGRECYNMTTGQVTSSEERIVFYLVFEDIFGNKSIVLRSDFPRAIRHLGLSSFGWAYGIVSLIVILCSLLVVLLTELLVVNPMLSLNQYLKRILKSIDTSSVIPVRGIREIATLTRRINNMLQVIDESYGQLQRDNAKLTGLLQKVSTEEQKSRTLMNSIVDLIMTVDKNSSDVILANNSFYSKTRYDSLKPVAVSQIFHETDVMVKINEISDTDSAWTTNITTRFGRHIPVSVTIKNAKLFQEEERDVYVIVAHDMTDNQSMQEKLMSNHEAIQTMQSIIDFNKMLRSPELRADFLKYCETEMSDENLLFLVAVDEYRHTLDAHVRFEKQNQISQIFLDQTGSKPLNLSSKVFEVAKHDIANGCGQFDLFDKLEKVVSEMVIKDTWFRYSSKK